MCVQKKIVQLAFAILAAAEGVLDRDWKAALCQWLRSMTVEDPKPDLVAAVAAPILKL